MPPQPPNKVTILKGTPNQAEFFFENPTNPTANDIAKVKKFYGIEDSASTEALIAELNKLKGVEQANILSDIPYDPQTQSKQYYSVLAQKIADTNQRMALIKDPANYYFKQANEALNKIPYVGGLLDRAIPDQLVSKPSAEIIGSLGFMAGAGLLTAPTMGTGAAAASILGADALGATAGGQIYELTNQLLRHLNDLPLEDQELQNAKFLKDAYLNLAFSGGAMSLGPIIKNFKPAVGRILFGLDNKNPEYKKMLEVAETYGMPLGIIQATNSAFWKGYSKVLGVFPYVGTPFRRAGEGTQEGIRKYFSNALDNFAPLQTMASLGGDMMQLARSEYKDTMLVSDALYKSFGKYAEKLDGKRVIKLDTVKRLADEFQDVLVSAKPGTQGYGFRFPGDGSMKAFTEFYQTLSKLDPDGVTIQQYRTLQKLLSDFQANFKVEGKGAVPVEEGARISQLRLALEQDGNKLINIDGVDKVIFDTAMEKLTRANAYLSGVMPKYKGPVANQYKLVNAQIFSPGPQSVSEGVLSPKQMLDALLPMAKNDADLMGALMRLAKTPNANLKAWRKAGMKEGVPVKVMVKELDNNANLADGSPNPNFGKQIEVEQTVISMAPNAGKKQIIRKIYDQALKDAFTGLPVAKTFDDYKNLAKLDPEQVYKQGYKNNADVYRFRTVDFDPKKFADNLGLNDVDGRAALKVALEGTGTKIKDIERFLDIAEKSGSFTVTDPSSFVQRRVTLGGFKSLLLFGGVQAGATAAGFGLPVLMVPLLLRYGSSILTDPKVLKSFSEVLADTGLDVAKRAGVARVVGKPGDTKESLAPFTISEKNKQILLDWANTTLPTEADLDQLDFVNEVEQSILSLMRQPQSQVEAKPARNQQLEMMSRMFGPRGYLTGEEAQIKEQIEDRLQPQFDANLGSTPRPDVSLQPNMQVPMQANVRNQLALGTLDDALATQMLNRGIGTL
jgi:hypothetical protein